MVASCNCVCLTALTCIVNYPERCTDEKGLEARRSRFLQPSAAKEIAFLPWALCVLTLAPVILNVNAYFMTELWDWGREERGRWVEENPCFFWGVHTAASTQCYLQRKLWLAFRLCCACVRVWVCAHSGVACVCIAWVCGVTSCSAFTPAFLLFCCVTQVQQITGATAGQQRVSRWSAS